MTDLFSEVRRLVGVEAAARLYGFEPDRSDRICCPFHEDEHPSLQLYPGGRGWWCYVCGMGGSVIDFTARLFSLSPREAALKLNGDFRLGLTAEAPRKLEARRYRHERLLQNRRKSVFQFEYTRRQNEFLELRRELHMLPRGGRAGEILGQLNILEEWFRENPWR